MPGIVYWEGVVSKGLATAVVSTMDIFSTIMDVAGGVMPTDKVTPPRRCLFPLLRSCRVV